MLPLVTAGLLSLSEPLEQYIINSDYVQQQPGLDHISIGSWKSNDSNSIGAEFTKLEKTKEGGSLGVIFCPELCRIVMEGGSCVKPVEDILEEHPIVLYVEAPKEEMELANFQFIRNAILLKKDVHLKNKLKIYKSQVEGTRPVTYTLRELALFIHFGYEIVPSDIMAPDEYILLRKANDLTPKEITELNSMAGFYDDATVRSEIQKNEQVMLRMFHDEL